MIVECHHHAVTFGGDFFVNLADCDISMRKTVVTQVDHLRAHQQRIWISNWKPETTLSGSKDGANAGLAQVIHSIDAVKVLDPGAFKVLEVHDIVDVLERVHIAPSDRYLDYY